MTVTVTKSAEAPWANPRLPEGLSEDQIARAMQVRRQGLANGDGGFFASRVVMPAGMVTDAHHHDHSELMVVLRGSMAFDDGSDTVVLTQNDSAAIEAGHVYGFTVGDDGVEFLLVRSALSTSHLAT
jgi:mannose-6-phosphate isomerase-like protein (cupin superfamily)